MEKNVPPPPSPPPHFGIYLHICCHEVPPVTDMDYFKKLGFVNGCDTLVYVSDKKEAKFPSKSPYALARSWFKEGVTTKDKDVSTDMRKKTGCYKSGDLELKGYLKELVEQAKAAKILARMARKKGKTVEKQVLSTPASRCAKKKFVPKMRSLNDILMAIDQERASNALV